LNLHAYALLTDENVHPEVVRALRRNGFDVFDVKESELTGSSDAVILREAMAQGRIVLTHDSDFGRLAIANSEPIVGIVYLRPGHIEPEFTLATLEAVFSSVPEVQEPFILVAERIGDRVKIRLRTLPLSPS
jgi:predicted nuclease of predicted toxin-antitoxin system